MAGRIWTFARDEGGATAIEYALMCSLLALAVILPLTNIGTKLSGYFSEVSTSLK
jgi:pilus assembly protein Flp/PilA